MPATRNVAVLIGSLRKESFTRKIAKAMMGMADPSLRMEIVEIGHLPFFNQDFEADLPQAIRDFKQKIESFDAVLFVTPEYNRSVPGVLKNAIDCGSRPYGNSAWSGKAAGVVSVSPGAIGGFGANHHLRQSLVFLEMPAMPREAYIGGVAKVFDDNGTLTNDSTREFLQKYLQAFTQWIERNAAK
jgi:chromate reductase, NAD(P)H dehydrogenase (quinone)